MRRSDSGSTLANQYLGADAIDGRSRSWIGEGKWRQDASAPASWIEEDAGVEDAFGIERAFDRLQGDGEAVGALAIVPGAMVAADGMVMSDGPAEAVELVGDGALDVIPLLKLRAALARREDGVIGRGPVGIGVSKPDGDGALAADAVDGVLRGSDHLGVEIGEAVPGNRGFESLAHHAHRNHGIAQVRSVEEGVAPGPGGALVSRVGVGARPGGVVGNLAAEIGATFERPLHPGLQRMIFGLKRKDHHSRFTIVGAGVGGLARVEQAAVRWIQSGLRDGAP